MIDGDKSFFGRLPLTFKCNALFGPNLRRLRSFHGFLFLARKLSEQLFGVFEESVALIQIGPAKRFNFSDRCTEILLGLKVNLRFYEAHSTGIHSRNLRTLGLRIFEWLFVPLRLVTGQIITGVGERGLEVGQWCPSFFES